MSWDPGKSSCSFVGDPILYKLGQYYRYANDLKKDDDKKIVEGGLHVTIISILYISHLQPIFTLQIITIFQIYFKMLNISTRYKYNHNLLSQLLYFVPDKIWILREKKQCSKF